MSVREEDTSKTSGSGRGLAIAAVAVGVGVGAALYYFFNKQTESPDGEGSTTQWERTQPFIMDYTDDYNDSSDYETTADTSVFEIDLNDIIEEQSVTVIDESYEESENENYSEDVSFELSDEAASTDHNDSDNIGSSHESYDWLTFDIHEEDGDNEMSSELEIVGDTDQEESSEASEFEEIENEYDNEFNINVHRSSIPSSGQLNLITTALHRSSPYFALFSDRITRSRARFRQRTWTLEECSICFEVLLQEKEEMALPCTHRFHTACILPWLKSRQTCPICRKKI